MSWPTVSHSWDRWQYDNTFSDYDSFSSASFLRSSKSYILHSINTTESICLLFTYHVEESDSVNDTHIESKKKKKNQLCSTSQRGGPNINRDLWSWGKLPLLALVHTLPEGIERCIRLDPNLHKDWKCFALLANEQLSKFKPHAKFKGLRVLM